MDCACLSTYLHGGTTAAAVLMMMTRNAHFHLSTQHREIKHWKQYEETSRRIELSKFTHTRENSINS